MLLAELTVGCLGGGTASQSSSGKRKTDLTFVKTIDGRFLSKPFWSLNLRALCPGSTRNLALLSKPVWQTES